ncbi:MAG: molecular chaperone TorD family protein [Desulfobacterota bacterium]|nr:molecular chaperone TorD family protein [Thermodesulfobacteriota bacterium]
MNPWKDGECGPSDPGRRSALFKLLSLGFRYPESELGQALLDGSFGEALQEILAALPHLCELTEGIEERLARIGEEIRERGLSELEVDYVRTFDVGAPRPPCPPYEGLNREGERTRIMLEVSEFYRHFGLQMSAAEGARDLPDGLAAELEFLHFLAFKEEQARTAGAPDLLAGYVLAEKDFLERHLNQWVPRFAARLQEGAANTFYSYLGHILGEVIRLETETLRVCCGRFPISEGPAAAAQTALSSGGPR